MPGNPMLEYIKNTMKQGDAFNTVSKPKLITISREYGCPGIPIAHAVTSALTASKKVEWTTIDKQIVNQAAEEFDVHPDILEKIAKSKPKGALEEFILSFSDIRLPDDFKVKKTLGRILRSVALHGNVVILGRGGVVLSRDIENSLHIHLHASVAWRVEKVKILEKMTSNTEAMGRIKIVDGERIFLRNYFAGENLDENIFDVSFNCEHLTQDQIVQSILKIGELKGI